MDQAISKYSPTMYKKVQSTYTGPGKENNGEGV